MGTIIAQKVIRRFKEPVILGFDGGGTNIRARAYPIRRGELEKKDIFHTTLKTDNYTKIDDVIAEVLDRAGKLKYRVKGMSFGLAGAFDGNKVKITNQPDWEEIDLKGVAEVFGVPIVGGVNDLEATAYGVVSGLDKGDLAVVNEGKIKPGNQAVIAPGTGLGEALIKDGVLPMSTEGGHSDFAPIGDIQKKLLDYLEKKHPEGSICYEDILSGDGLIDIWEFLAKEAQDYKVPDFLKSVSDKKQKAALIAKAAIDKADPYCVKALEIFTDVLAAEASNLALKSLARGGVYLAGNAAKDLPFILSRKAQFMEAFTRKRKQRELVTDIPVKVITRRDVNELGAAYFVSKKILSLVVS